MTDPNSELSSRIDELESRLAFQDDVIESLNQVVSRQDHDLAMLTLRLQELSAKINEIGDAAAAANPSSESEIPPHY
jgi:SlyX protein